MKTKHILFLGILLIFVYYIPVLILGLDSYIHIHDGLDGEFIYRILMNLKEGTREYSNGVIHQVMNGFQRYAAIRN